jgi:hypothetical protein
MARQSKATQALLAQFPTFRDWIVYNLTPDQLCQIGASSIEATAFPGDHPLNSRKLGVQLWRAFEGAVVFAAFYPYPGEFICPTTADDRQERFHRRVCMAIHLLLTREPELLVQSAERHRGDIDAATGFGQPRTGHPEAGNGRIRL